MVAIPIAFAQNPLDPNQAERAVSGISFPNVASISFTYMIPTFGSTKTLVGKLINGWQINSIWVYNSGQPFTDIDLGTQNGSPAVNPSDPRTLTSYSDQKEATAFNAPYDIARPVLSNKRAPVGTIGIYTTTTTAGKNSAPFLVDYNTGDPTTPSQVHWIANNQYAGLLGGTPWIGSGRNLLRGTSYNNVDSSVFKNTKLTERLTLRLEVDSQQYP